MVGPPTSNVPFARTTRDLVTALDRYSWAKTRVLGHRVIGGWGDRETGESHSLPITVSAANNHPITTSTASNHRDRREHSPITHDHPAASTDQRSLSRRSP